MQGVPSSEACAPAPQSEGGSGHYDLDLQTLPADVEGLLRVAYGEEFGKIGWDLAGHSVSDVDVASSIADGQGSSLTYGELLPVGVARLQDALFTYQGEGAVLELGMGTGKVALQIFLTENRDVYGVELAPSRYSLADAAMQRLAASHPSRFTYEGSGDGSSRLCDLIRGRTCDFVRGSLLHTSQELLASASAVIMEVCLPLEVRRQACVLLQGCSSGCRVVCYSALHGLCEGCRLSPKSNSTGAAIFGDCAGGLRLAASWREDGHGFAFYEVASSPEIAAAAWENVEANCCVNRVVVDTVLCPSRARSMRHTDDVLGSPRRGQCSWKVGERVWVGWSWLPFLDLGDPGETTDSSMDGVTWMCAVVSFVDEEGLTNISYLDDGTIEEKVHPGRIRQDGVARQREPLCDWGE